jgi:GntR family transcriptional regulator, rspAB operon transcriptional repressor
MTKDMEPVYQDIQDNIIMMNLKPGTQLREIDVSDRYHVSRTPMRDVLKKLENDRLIDVHSQRGTFVTKIELNGINDIMYLRSVAEYAVMSDLQGKISSEGIAHLRDMIGTMEGLLKGNTSAHDQEFAAAFFKLDNSFHNVIFGMDGKEGILKLLNDSFPYFSRYRFLTFYRDEEYLTRLFAIHSKLIDCLEGQDKEMLKEVVQEHNFSGLNGIDKVKNRHPDYFE